MKSEINKDGSLFNPQEKHRILLMRRMGFAAIGLGGIIFLVSEWGRIGGHLNFHNPFMNKGSTATHNQNTSKKIETEIQKGIKDSAEFEQQLKSLKLDLKNRKEKIGVLNQMLKQMDRSIEDEFNSFKKWKNRLIQWGNEYRVHVENIEKSVRDKPEVVFKRWSEIKQLIVQQTQSNFVFKSSSYNKLPSINFSQDNLFDEQSPYMNPSGLRTMRTLVAGTMSLGKGEMVIPYSKTKLIYKSRAHVTQKFIDQISGRKLNTRTEPMEDSAIQSSQGVEIWIPVNKGSEVTD